MGVPKTRKTSSRRDQRRMHIFVKQPFLTLCPKCKKPVRAHTACSFCGYYKGREVIDVMKKLEKKERKQREKEMKETEKEEKKEKPMTLEELSKKKF